MRAVSHPDERDPPLVVDSDTVLTCSIAFELFQPISGRGHQVFEMRSAVEHGQLSFSYFLKAGELFDGLSCKQELRLLVPKPSDHAAQSSTDLRFTYSVGRCGSPSRRRRIPRACENKKKNREYFLATDQRGLR